MRCPTVAAAVLLPSTLGTALNAQAPERYTLRGADVTVYDPAGRVQVVTGSGSDVIVEVTRHGRDAGRLRVLAGEVRGRDALRVVAPSGDLIYRALGPGSRASFRVRSDGTFGDDEGGPSEFRSDWMIVRGEGRGTEAWADMIVRVPSGRRLTVRVGGGEVAAHDLDADLSLATYAGNASAEHTRGCLTVSAGTGAVHVRDVGGTDLRMATGSGALDVRGARADRLRIATGSGGVRGEGLEGTDVQLDSGAGDLHFDLVRARSLRVRSGSGSANIGIAGELHEATVATGSGDVTLRVRPTFGATLDASTGGGNVHSELPLQVTQQNAHHISGRLGDGRATVRVVSGSGDLRFVSMVSRPE